MINAGLTYNRSMLFVLSKESDLATILDSILDSINLSISYLSFKVAMYSFLPNLSSKSIWRIFGLRRGRSARSSGSSPRVSITSYRSNFLETSS